MCNLAVECRKASEVFAKVLADGTIGIFVDFRIGGESPVKFFAKLFYKKGLSRRHYGVCVTLRLSAVRQVDFFAKLFWIKKRVFGYFFQKVTSLIKTSLFVLMGKFPTEIFPF